ncbi:MAG: adenylyl-sulfate kinase [Deltaproteobacteria bacterium]|nr:MAG: adenylyl-sulfate kinase [Deltaproteobacteria bacterium]
MVEACKAKNNNVTWFNGHVTRKDREKLHGHKVGVVWFTGLSASGKSTIAHQLEKELHMRGCSSYVLDGDNVRHGLCSDLSFTPEDRSENIRRIGEMVKLFVDAGILVLTAFISPYKSDRDKVRSLFPGGEFVEVYVECPEHIRASRDEKGIYKRAKAGEIENFTGISAPYEIPQNPDLVIRSHHKTPEEAALSVITLLERRRLFQWK